MGTNKQQLNQAEINELTSRRGSFIRISSKIVKIAEPRIFQLKLENVSNVRNSIIVSAALATVSLLVLSNSPKDLPLIVETSQQVAVIGFLITILIYSFYLKHNVGGGLSAYQEKVQENVDLSERGQDIINKCFDGEISKVDADQQLLILDEEIEHTKIRIKSKDEKDKDDNFAKYLGIIGNLVFIGAIAILVFSFLYEILVSLFLKYIIS